MHDVVAVAVVNRGEHLLDYVSRVLLTEVLLPRDALEEFSTLAELSDKEVALRVLEELEELKDIWVVHLLQNADLRQQLLLLVLLQVLFVDYLDGSLGPRFFRDDPPDFTLGTYKK